MEDFGYGMEENCQYGIWKNCLPFHSILCPAFDTEAMLFDIWKVALSQNCDSRTQRVKHNRKFVDHNLEKLHPWP